MKDSLTESVARLYRAGSEHSQQTQKLQVAVDSLLRWIKEKIPNDFVLPCDAYMYPSGEFEWKELWGDRMSPRIITLGTEHSVFDLVCFSKLISDGFLDKLSEKLEAEAMTFQKTSKQIDSFVTPS